MSGHQDNQVALAEEEKPTVQAFGGSDESGGEYVHRDVAGQDGVSK